MSYRARCRLTAWLGLIAMCLVAFAPTLSHFVRASRAIAVPVCTVQGEDAAHRIVLAAGPMSMSMSGHPDSGSSLPMDDCGYCDLLNHAPAMAGVPPAPAAPLLLLFAVFVLPALTRHTPLGAFPSGRPRAPPIFS